VSDLGVNSSLLIATLDLSLVRNVIGAIRTADITSAAEKGASGGTVTQTYSTHYAAAQTVVVTKTVRGSDQPAATFEPSSVRHLHPRMNQLQPYSCNRPVTPTDCGPTIQPPWKVLPWPIAVRSIHPHGIRVVKIPPNRTDVDNVGRMLDLFV
jgi:hypothetical protein